MRDPLSGEIHKLISKSGKLSRVYRDVHFYSGQHSYNSALDLEFFRAINFKVQWQACFGAQKVTKP